MPLTRNLTVTDAMSTFVMPKTSMAKNLSKINFSIPNVGKFAALRFPVGGATGVLYARRSADGIFTGLTLIESKTMLIAPQRYLRLVAIGFTATAICTSQNMDCFAEDEKPAADKTAVVDSEPQADKSSGDDSKQASPAQIAIRKLAEQCVFEPVTKAAQETTPFELRNEPLLRYGDSAQDIGTSALWVWMDDGIPAMFQKIEVNVYQGSNDKWTWCFANGSSQKVKCGWPQVKRQGVEADFVPLKPVPGNPEVKASSNALAFTARQLSRQFAARDEVDVLRLLPRPLLEFNSEQKGISYGAVFAMATGTNPSMLLILQTEKTDDGERWMFRPVHMTSWSVVLEHDGKTICKDPGQKSSQVSTWGYFFTSRPGNIK